MSPPTTSLRPRPDPLARWTFIGSIAVHAVGLGVALLITRAGAATPVRNPTRPIVAKLVRLGKKRDPSLLPRLDRAPPPPPKVAKVLPPDPRTRAAPASPKVVRDATPERSALDLDAAISRIAADYDPDATPEAALGDPDGDPRGTAADAAEGDRYLALVERAIHDRYKVPNTISERERVFLKATVVIFVSPDGRILRREIEVSSGNGLFDSALLGAVDAASPLPPPPAGWREVFQHEGLGLRFKI